MILVVNAGSSSLKFTLYNYAQQAEHPFSLVAKGLYERIGSGGHFNFKDQKNQEQKSFPLDLADHYVAASHLLNYLKTKNFIENFSDLAGIGHRVVNMGSDLRDSVLIDKKVMEQFQANMHLAPLHNPPAVTTIKAFQKVTTAPNIAVFDTGFHKTIPNVNYLYPVPYEWYSKYHVRKYGMHGISYRFICQKLAKILNVASEDVNAIVCHIGNGASVCAIKKGMSYATSMGLTPLEGLMMGTRSGNVDPALGDFMHQVANISQAEYCTILNKQSGLLGVSGVSNDMRDLLKAQADNPRVKIALEMFINRIVNYISMYQNEYNTPPAAVVLTAGIGENSAYVAQAISARLKTLPLQVDSQLNEQNYQEWIRINDETLSTGYYKMRTNEEIMICQDVAQLIKG